MRKGIPIATAAQRVDRSNKENDCSRPEALVKRNMLPHLYIAFKKMILG